jgi:hypothetical protein
MAALFSFGSKTKKITLIHESCTEVSKENYWHPLS